MGFVFSLILCFWFLFHVSFSKKFNKHSLTLTLFLNILWNNCIPSSQVPLQNSALLREWVINESVKRPYVNPRYVQEKQPILCYLLLFYTWSAPPRGVCERKKGNRKPDIVENEISLKTTWIWVHSEYSPSNQRHGWRYEVQSSRGL